MTERAKEPDKEREIQQEPNINIMNQPRERNPSRTGQREIESTERGINQEPERKKMNRLGEEPNKNGQRE